jgi:hypothetical protein
LLGRLSAMGLSRLDRPGFLVRLSPLDRRDLLADLRGPVPVPRTNPLHGRHPLPSLILLPGLVLLHGLVLLLGALLGGAARLPATRGPALLSLALRLLALRLLALRLLALVLLVLLGACLLLALPVITVGIRASTAAQISIRTPQVTRISIGIRTRPLTRIGTGTPPARKAGVWPPLAVQIGRAARPCLPSACSARPVRRADWPAFLRLTPSRACWRRSRGRWGWLRLCRASPAQVPEPRVVLIVIGLGPGPGLEIGV